MSENTEMDVHDCTRCPKLVESRTRIVNGDGPADADLALVGEAPGADEDRQGRPFVGRSGDVLDDALGEAGLGREDVRIVNCVRCRPPENRDPTAAELDNCRGYLERELSALDPGAVLALGKVPAEHLLGRSVSVTSAASDVFDARIDGRPYRVVVSVHPAASLYDPSQSGKLADAVRTAAEVAGLDAGAGGDDGDGDDGGGQSRLGEF